MTRHVHRIAKSRIAIVTTLLVAALGSSVSVAEAAPAGASFPHYDHAMHANEIWGGYSDTDGTFTSVSADWNVPSLDCTTTPSSAVSPWVGLDGYYSGTVEQIGLDQDCGHGKAEYHPWVEMYPAGPTYFTDTIQAGDAIKASVNVTGTNFTLTESDTTQGWSKTFHETGTADLSSAEVILEDLGNKIPAVANFGSITFRNATANGVPLASAGTPNSDDIERGNTPLTHNSRLNGGQFTMTWLRA
ncbi:G1 family glutamic endopeptidase [Kitasatospora sp. NPDC052896]|uniref:G1 family glutamic endopeptidase n=1 Tax=Kitasatospora sp. NPDC052896 TaxID=3364061 RepID=UPI0037C9F6CD